MTKDTLIIAAQAVIERWDSPHWKDLPHTGDYIDALRKAVNQAIEEPDQTDRIKELEAELDKLADDMVAMVVVKSLTNEE